MALNSESRLRAISLQLCFGDVFAKVAHELQEDHLETKCNKFYFLTVLPDDVLEIVFNKLDFRSLLCVSRVCRKLHKLAEASQSELWQLHYHTLLRQMRIQAVCCPPPCLLLRWTSLHIVILWH